MLDVNYIMKEAEAEGNKRWFYGEASGAFLLDEIKYWKPIRVTPPAYGQIGR